MARHCRAESVVVLKSVCVLLVRRMPTVSLLIGRSQRTRLSARLVVGVEAAVRDGLLDEGAIAARQEGARFGRRGCEVDVGVGVTVAMVTVASAIRSRQAISRHLKSSVESDTAGPSGMEAFKDSSLRSPLH